MELLPGKKHFQPLPKGFLPPPSHFTPIPRITMHTNGALLHPSWGSPAFLHTGGGDRVRPSRPRHPRDPRDGRRQVALLPALPGPVPLRPHARHLPPDLADEGPGRRPERPGHPRCCLEQHARLPRTGPRLEEGLRDGRLLRLLFISPEKCMQPNFLSSLAQAPVRLIGDRRGALHLGVGPRLSRRIPARSPSSGSKEMPGHA